MKTLLLIEDDPIMGESLLQRFQLEGWDVTWVRRLSEAEIGSGDLPDAVVSDVRLPDGLATNWFQKLPAAARAVPWFVLTGYGSVNEAIAAIRSGAREYLTKPVDIERLVRLIQESGGGSGGGSDAVLGISAAMRRVESMARKVARQKVAVLLTGESGVGKEVAARLIHGLDARGTKTDFVAVNCAAVPETMAEAEFFGYEKGAFSGAQRAHRGFLERAHGGTLFLDEVGDLAPAMQAKLLRALQEHCFFRLGAETVTHSDFRIVAATNRDLHADMASGRFREDLFYRIAVVSVNLPPLRERPEDIRWLTERMLQEIAAEQGRPLAVSEPFMRDLVTRPWKGNVRELRAHLEQSVVLSDSGLLDVDDAASANGVASAPAAEPSDAALQPLQALVADAERQHIRRAMEHTGGSVSRTAEVLGISRKTLWEKMKKLGL
jgi:DNA-binding NtrC family response regulator